MSRNTRLRWAGRWWPGSPLVAGRAAAAPAASRREDSATSGGRRGQGGHPARSRSRWSRTARRATPSGTSSARAPQAAAAKDNVDLKYSADPDAGKQAELIQNAIDSKVDGIAVTLPDPDGARARRQEGDRRRHPGGRVQRRHRRRTSEFGGADLLRLGREPGRPGRRRAARRGRRKNVLCVIQEQGQVQLEARCAGVEVRRFSGKYEQALRQRRGPAVGARPRSRQAAAGPERSTTSSRWARRSRWTRSRPIKDAGSTAKVATFDLNAQIPPKIKAGELQFAIDQQPYLQGYVAIDSLWLYKVERQHHRRRQGRR